MKNEDDERFTHSEDYQQLLQQLRQLDAEFVAAQLERRKLEEVLEEEMDEPVRLKLRQFLTETQLRCLTIDQQRTELRQQQEVFVPFAQAVEQTASQLLHLAVLPQVRQLIDKGCYRQADALLDPIQMERMKDDLRTYYRHLANLYLLKAQLTSNPATQADNPNWFPEADLYYRNALDAHTDYHTLLAYADFLRLHNQSPAAISYYQQCLPFVQTDQQRADLFNKLGVLYRIQRDYKSALGAYREALHIRRQLAETEPEIYGLLAITLNNIGLVQCDQHNPTDALPALEEALSIQKNQPQTEGVRHDLATTLNSMGIMYLAQYNYPAALMAYQQSLATYQAIAQTNPSTYLPDVAMALTNIGHIHHKQQNFQAGLDTYKEAIDLYRTLAQANPYTHLPLLAHALNNLGTLNGEMGDLTTALVTFEEALSLRRTLATTDPRAHLTDVAGTLSNIAAVKLSPTKLCGCTAADGTSRNHL